MKRILSVALTLVLIVSALGAAEAPEAEEEQGSNWTVMDSLVEDDFGDETHWATLSYIETITTTADREALMSVTIIPAEGARGLSDTAEGEKLFGVIILDGSPSRFGEQLLDDQEVKLKIKVDEEQYETTLTGAQKYYYAFSEGNELYEKLVESLESEKTVKCVVISETEKLQFQLDGFGFSDAFDMMNEYNEANAAEKEEQFEIQGTDIVRK